MPTPGWPPRSGPRLIAALLGAGWLVVCTTVAGAEGVVTAPARTFTPRFRGYAQVEPVAPVEVRAAQAGVVSGLTVLPGDAVEAGQVLLRLTGPEPEALSAERSGAVEGARAELNAARKTLVIEREQQTSHLSTKETLNQAEAALARAKANLETARARLKALQQMQVVSAPVAGRVGAVSAASGERVAPGQSILTLIPVHGLWLRAQYYGTDADSVRPGMRGEFAPASGAPSVAVQVRTLVGLIRPDGARSVGLVATGPRSGWLDGEAGTVTLEGAARTLAAVPTRALVLDQGRWWVLVHGPGGERPQAVTPAASRGEWTLIEKGLAPGTEIVVENVYLEFHRAFSQHYQPPD